MHKSALEIGSYFLNTVLYKNARVLEIGSANVNGGLRREFEQKVKWVGVDLHAGNGVDVVLSDPYVLPFEDDSFDFVFSSSTFEHNAMFWLTFSEAVRVSAPGGIIYLNTPSNGLVHRHPIDAYRFFPDAGIALSQWATRCGMVANLVESFVAERNPRASVWNDLVTVFEVDSRDFEPFLFSKFKCRNAIIFDKKFGKLRHVNRTGLTEDLEELRESRHHQPDS